MIEWIRKTHMQSDRDLRAIISKQGPIIPALKISPIPVQCVKETNPFPTVDRELDDPGAPGYSLLSGRPKGFLRHKFPSGLRFFVILGTPLAFTPAFSVRTDDSFRVQETGRLKGIILTPLECQKQQQEY